MNKPFLFKRVWSLFTCDLCTQCWGEGTVSLWHHLLEKPTSWPVSDVLCYMCHRTPHWSCPVVRAPTTSVRCSMLGADTYYTLLTAAAGSMLTDDADQVPDCQHLMSQDTVSWCNQPATDCPQIALLIYILMLENETAIKCFAAKRLKKSRNPAACLRTCISSWCSSSCLHTELRDEAVSEDLIGQWMVNPFLHLLAKVTC